MADDIQEVVAEATEFVSDEAEKFAEFTRQLNKIKVQFALFGTVVGATGGALAAWVIAYRRAEAAANARADDEIAQEREHYQAKALALEAQAGKKDLDDLVKEKGYSSSEDEKPVRVEAPLAVQPPSSVVVAEDEMAGEPPDDSEMAEDGVEGPNGVKAEPETRNVFRERQKEAARTAPFEWVQEDEERKRSSDQPYVIARDEVYTAVNDGFSEESLTYYAEDDVLCNEREEVIDPADRDRLVGDANLDRFGHGSGDPAIVYIRNDGLDILYEIVRSPNSFAEEVHGIRHSGWDRGNLERFHRRERDAEA
jgi:hypothetical protein